MKETLKTELIKLYEEMLVFAEFDKEHIEILQKKVERIKEIKKKI
jgi:hypothetical protein